MLAKVSPGGFSRSCGGWLWPSRWPGEAAGYFQAEQRWAAMETSSIGVENPRKSKGTGRKQQNIIHHPADPAFRSELGAVSVGVKAEFPRKAGCCNGNNIQIK